jgi:hypothetical protein
MRQKGKREMSHFQHFLNQDFETHSVLLSGKEENQRAEPINGFNSYIKSSVNESSLERHVESTLCSVSVSGF